MKKKIELFISLIILTITTSSCVTNYYTVILEQDTNLYKNSSTSSNLKTIIPKGTEIFITNESKNLGYRKIRWNYYRGWTYKPSYKSYNNYAKNNNSYKSSTPYKSTYSGGTVHVKGYYRKDGTYVRPHTRSAQKKRY
jgi:hypothetical protein